MNVPKPIKLGLKSIKNLVGFWGDLKTPKFYSEINLPLPTMTNTILGKEENSQKVPRSLDLTM